MNAACGLLIAVVSAAVTVSPAAAADMPGYPPAPPPTGYYGPPVEQGYVAPPPAYAYPPPPAYYYAPPVAVVPEPYYARPYYDWGYGRPYARGYRPYGYRY